MRAQKSSLLILLLRRCIASRRSPPFDLCELVTRWQYCLWTFPLSPKLLPTGLTFDTKDQFYFSFQTDCFHHPQFANLQPTNTSKLSLLLGKTSHKQPLGGVSEPTPRSCQDTGYQTRHGSPKGTLDRVILRYLVADWCCMLARNSIVANISNTY